MAFDTQLECQLAALTQVVLRVGWRLAPGERAGYRDHQKRCERAPHGFRTAPDCNYRMIELAKHRFAINQDDSPAIAPIASIVGLKVENPATPAVRREAEEEWGAKRAAGMS